MSDLNYARWLCVKFWEWEYTRRSPDYSEKYNEIITCRKCNYGGDYCGAQRIGNFMVMRSESKTIPSSFYSSANEIIDNLIDGSFDYSFPSKGLMTLGQSFAGDIVKTCIKKDNFLDLKIDLNNNTEAILYELKKIVLWHKDSRHDNKGLELELKLAKARSSLKRTPPESSTPSRAIGLWLWDYINEKNCSIAEAKRAMAANLDLMIFKVENKDDTEFRFWYNRTKECIALGKVLNFSKHKKKGT